MPVSPVPLPASGQVRVADSPAARVTVFAVDGSDSPYAVAAVIL